MPTTSTIAVFALAAFVLIAIPGPNTFYIVTRGASQGWPAAAMSALGIETATILHITAAAVGISAVLASSALAFDVVKYAGAAYLLYLGVKTLRGSPPNDIAEPTYRAKPRLGRVYLQGVLVNLLNPKVALFFLAFLPQFVHADRGTTLSQILVLGAVFLCVACTMSTTTALVSGSIGSWLRRRPSFQRRQHFLTGGIYLSLGLYAAIAGGGHHQTR